MIDDHPRTAVSGRHRQVTRMGPPEGQAFLRLLERGREGHVPALVAGGVHIGDVLRDHPLSHQLVIETCAQEALRGHPAVHGPSLPVSTPTRQTKKPKPGAWARKVSRTREWQPGDRRPIGFRRPVALRRYLSAALPLHSRGTYSIGTS